MNRWLTMLLGYPDPRIQEECEHHWHPGLWRLRKEGKRWSS